MSHALDRAPDRSLQRVLAPTSIAVVGGAAAERVVRQNLKLGFPGALWPIHPTRREIAGVPCLPSIDALPAVPDAAFVGVNRNATIDAVRDFAALGAGGAVCYGSGFAESGDAAMQQRLLEAAGDMPFFGPNCYGFVNTFDRVALWPDEHGCGRFERGAAFVSQSGNVACNLTFQRRSVRMGTMITVGNQARLGVEDCIDACLDDQRITTIGLFIEAVRDATRFAEVAERAHRQRVPIVALQTGRSAAGAQIATTHTGSMSGRAAAYDALFARCGVVTVATPSELLETVKVLDRWGWTGPRTVSLSCSGGEASLVADRAEGSPLQFDDFTPAHTEAVASTLPELVTVSNPLDYHTFIWGDRAAMAATFTAVMDGPQDTTVLVLDAPTAPGLDPRDWHAAADAFADAAAATGGRAAVLATLAEGLDDVLQQRLVGRGVVPLLGLVEGLRALAAAAVPPTNNAYRHVPAPPPVPTVVIDEADAKQRLRAMGVAVPDGSVVDANGVAAAAADIGFPVTLKALGLAHKSEHGAVAVGLGDQDAVASALRTMPPTARYLVESTVTDVVAELVVAVRADHPIGWLVTVGYGGVATEVWADMVHVLAPVSVDEVVAAVQRLRCAPLLRGYRGRPPADIAAFAELVVTVVNGVVSSGAREVELNPVLVGHHGAVAVDALWLHEASTRRAHD
jgi:acyl-CoA synthetase (NDP forming)